MGLIGGWSDWGGRRDDKGEVFNADSKSAIQDEVVGKMVGMNGVAVIGLRARMDLCVLNQLM